MGLACASCCSAVLHHRPPSPHPSHGRLAAPVPDRRPRSASTPRVLEMVGRWRRPEWQQFPSIACVSPSSSSPPTIGSSRGGCRNLAPAAATAPHQSPSRLAWRSHRASPVAGRPSLGSRPDPTTVRRDNTGYELRLPLNPGGSTLPRWRQPPRRLSGSVCLDVINHTWTQCLILSKCLKYSFRNFYCMSISKSFRSIEWRKCCTDDA